MSGESSVRRVDLDFTIKLPANAPDGLSHLIEANREQDGKSTTELTVADVICTMIFKCNPVALHDLLNIDIDESLYSLDTCDDSKRGYVARSGNGIEVSIFATTLTAVLGLLERLCHQEEMTHDI